MLLSVVIPCRNEAGSVSLFAEKLLPALDELGLRHEVIVVNDGSEDETADVLLTLAGERPGIKSVSHDRNRGLGAALRTGFAAAEGDWIVALDADMSFHPSQIRALLERQRETGADLVAGSPFLTPEGSAEVAWRRRLPSALINALYRVLCGRQLTAYTPIFRLYRAAALRKLRLRSEGFEINAEIAARFLAAGMSVAEVPARLGRRRQGASKLNAPRELWRHAVLMARILLKR